MFPYCVRGPVGIMRRSRFLLLLLCLSKCVCVPMQMVAQTLRQQQPSLGRKLGLLCRDAKTLDILIESA